MKRLSVFIVGVILTVIFVGFGIFLATSKVNKAYAYANSRRTQRFSTSHTGGMMRTGNTMRGEDRQEMINMMRNHHGENWQDHHNNMMKEE